MLCFCSQKSEELDDSVLASLKKENEDLRKELNEALKKNEELLIGHESRDREYKVLSKTMKAEFKRLIYSLLNLYFNI